MKKIAIGLFTLVLALSVLTGCGCTNSAAPAATQPTRVPATEATRPVQTQPETSMPSVSTSVPTEMPTVTEDAPTMETEETTPPMSKESGRVKSHVNGNF